MLDRRVLLFAGLLILFGLPYQSQAQQTVQGKAAAIPKNVERKIQRDAARLALRSLATDRNFASQPIVIPAAKFNELYNALSKTYQSSELARSLEKCDVHSFPDPSIDHLVLIFDKKSAWAAPLYRGAAQTASPQFNGLVEKYSLSIEKQVQWDEGHDALIIRSQTPLNMAALAVVFQKIDGVTDLQLGIPSTSGNDLQARRVSGAWEFTYLLRFGSYISGQGKEHRWVFKVPDNGPITFQGESGDPVPSWIDCAP